MFITRTPYIVSLLGLALSYLTPFFVLCLVLSRSLTSLHSDYSYTKNHIGYTHRYERAVLCLLSIFLTTFLFSFSSIGIHIVSALFKCSNQIPPLY